MTKQQPYVCGPCTLGDHTSHKPALGGLCLGCCCNHRPPVPSVNHPTHSHVYCIEDFALRCIDCKREPKIITAGLEKMIRDAHASGKCPHHGVRIQ